MGKSSKPNFEAPPSFQAFPTVEPDINFLSQVGRGLASGNFLNPNDPQLGFLNPLVSLNPEATQKAFGLATRDIVELRDRAQQDTLNQLEANNQLTSSTSVNRLSDLNEAFSSDIADVATNLYLADVERTMTNIGGLFGTGLNTVNQAVGLGQNQQQQRNAFNLEEYDRKFALEAERFSRQQANEAAQAKLWGAFTGPGGGAIAGSIIGGPTTGMAGYNEGWNTVNRIAGLAGSFSGMSGGGGLTTSGGFSPSAGTFTGDQGFQMRNDLLTQRRLGGLA